MGTRSERFSRNKKRKNRRLIWGCSALVFALGLVVTGIVLLCSANRFEKLLTENGIAYDSLREENGTVSLSVSGNAEDLFSLCDVLSILRNAENPPSRIVWTFFEGSRTVSGVSSGNPISADDMVRAETLSDAMTCLKLKYELEQSGLSVSVRSESGAADDGKMLCVDISLGETALKEAALPLSDALASVNAEGGGIVRCDVRFLRGGDTVATRSFDLLRGEILSSSAFAE